jgi:capsular polysaccharide biosynthesis protein
MSGQALDLKRSAQIVWRLRALVGSVIALGFLAGAVYTALSPARYESTTLVAVSPSTPVASQAAVVTSPQVLVAALRTVDRGMTLDALAERIHAQYASAGLMSITAAGETPSQAIQTVNVVTRSYLAYASSANSPAGALQVRPFEAADSAEGTSLGARLFYAAGAGILIGALIGVIIAIAVGRTNQPLRERDEIADSAGVPILGSVRTRRAARAAGWQKLLDGYEPAPADAWRLRKVLRELGHSRSSPASLAGDGHSVAVLSLSGDRKALALGPQLAAFAAAAGIPATLVLDARPGGKATAALRTAATAAAGPRRPENLSVIVLDEDDAAPPSGGLAIVVAVVDGRAPRVASTMRATTTLLGVTSGAATAQQLVRVVASAAGDGRDIEGILVADPDPADPTTGRRPQLARPGQHRMPRRMTTAVMEIRS